MKENKQQHSGASKAAANQDAGKKSDGKSLPARSTVIQKQEDTSATANKTGLPDNLKSGLENLSGMSMDNVNVHYNSSKPAQLKAHAYAQGENIHVAAGQEKHLAHEAWHVVQQKQGRVKPTEQLKGKNINNDAALEQEADTMGEKAASQTSTTGAGDTVQAKFSSVSSTTPIQRKKARKSLDEEEQGMEMRDLSGQTANSFLDPGQMDIIASISPGTLDVMAAWGGGLAERNSNNIEGATGGAAIGGGVSGIMTSGDMDSLGFERKSEDAKKETMGMGKGSTGIVGSIGASAGLAASVGKAGAQGYGAYKDYKSGKFDASTGGKGWKSAVTGAGRGLSTAADITTNALKTTQAISAVTGNASAFGAAAAGLGPMAMITAGFQGVRGLHNAKLNKDREAKAKEMSANSKNTAEQKELFEYLETNKREKKAKGIVDAGMGASTMIAAGLMLNPVTAPVGMAMGATLGIGQGAYTAFKALRQKGRDSAAEKDKKAAMTPEQIVDAKRKEYQSTVDAAKDSWNPWKKRKAAQAEAKLKKLEDNPEAFGASKQDEYKKNKESKWGRFITGTFDKQQSTEAQKEKRDGMAKKMQGLDPEMQQEAMSGIMGINKYEKNEDGSLKMEKDAEGNDTKVPAQTPFFKGQIMKRQTDFVKKHSAEVVANTAKELSLEKPFESADEAIKRIAAALGMDESIAERDMVSDKLK